MRHCIYNSCDAIVKLDFSLAGHFHLYFNTGFSTELPLVLFDPWWLAGSWLNTLSLPEFYVILLLMIFEVF